MRVATVDGLLTLFYNNSTEAWIRDSKKEWDAAVDKIRAKRQRTSSREDEADKDFESFNISESCKKWKRDHERWEQIIIEEGVIVIPKWSFSNHDSIKRVICSNTVVTIEEYAFFKCENLVYVKLSINIQYIRPSAFHSCNLSSIFIPPSCREIGESSTQEYNLAQTFANNKHLRIVHIPQHVVCGAEIIHDTDLIEYYPKRLLGEFEEEYPQDSDSDYDEVYIEQMAEYQAKEAKQNRDIHNWIKNMNAGEEYDLHRACSSYQPLVEVIYGIVEHKKKSLVDAFTDEWTALNEIEVMPSEYLNANPFACSELDFLRYYIKKKMGEP